MLKKKYILGILLAIFMFCAVVSAVDEVSAAKYKVIDKGIKYFDFYEKKDKEIKSVWKTQSNGKKIVVDWKNYRKFGKKNYKLFSDIRISMTKVSKTKVKVTYTYYRTKYGPYSKSTTYDRSNLSINRHYSEYYKSGFRML